MARRSEVRKVYSVDVSYAAAEYQRENVRLNGVENVVEPILGDAAGIIKAGLRDVAHRVLMPLPERALQYLGYAIIALRPGEGGIHYYEHISASRDEDPIREVEKRASRKMAELGLDFKVSLGRVVRTVGLRRFQVVLGLLVHKEYL
ncbi:MAG: hypothetical protein JSW61_01925 [Candidatus Thorarchaeota archaeon]|nr:MAG: hypothetical protein JSW61_01925 [Candidatus Thorarchaeota archaeon]